MRPTCLPRVFAAMGRSLRPIRTIPTPVITATSPKETSNIAVGDRGEQIYYSNSSLGSAVTVLRKNEYNNVFMEY